MEYKSFAPSGTRTPVFTSQRCNPLVGNTPLPTTRPYGLVVRSFIEENCAIGIYNHQNAKRAIPKFSGFVAPRLGESASGSAGS